MRIGLPRELKDGEFRVALSPRGVAELVRAGHHVTVERGAGAGVGFGDAEYAAAGAGPGDAAQAWESDLIVKVKELQPQEYRRPRAAQIVFCFQHFGPEPELLDAALASGASYLAYETVGQADGSLPILAPMSAIAGRLAVPVGMWCLQKQNGGSGVLLSGVTGVAPGRVVILGAGNVGANALAMASAIGARVVVFARSERRFAHLQTKYPAAELRADQDGIAAAVVAADLVIGGVLTPGQMSPKLLRRETLRRMRPGSALVDVGIDQGGIAETSRPTSHSEPIFVEEDVVHYCVPNMPAACARSASLALEAAALPYVAILARDGLRGAIEERPELSTAVQVSSGKITHAHLARDTGRPCTALAEVLR